MKKSSLRKTTSASGEIRDDRSLNSTISAKEGWLRIRIGIHTGAVVAGVIGRKKFSYDVWGNTVNIASKMEHNSVAGSILISEETYKRLRSNYSFIERGEIELKGKGSMKTYFLTGRKSADITSSAETIRNTTLQAQSKISKRNSFLNECDKQPNFAPHKSRKLLEV